MRRPLMCPVDSRPRRFWATACYSSVSSHFSSSRAVMSTVFWNCFQVAASWLAVPSLLAVVFTGLQSVRFSALGLCTASEPVLLLRTLY